jgi:hypothetical protein
MGPVAEPGIIARLTSGDPAMPGDRVVWNRGIPFREIDGPWGVTVFAGARRLESLAAGAMGVVVGAAAWGFYRLTGSGALLGVGAALSLGLLCVATFVIWSKRVLVVDHGRREISLVRTSPWRSRRTAYPFSSLRSVSIEEIANPEGYEGEPLAIVGVALEDGSQLVLGRTYREDALAHARRIAGLTGIPVDPLGPEACRRPPTRGPWPS